MKFLLEKGCWRVGAAIAVVSVSLAVSCAQSPDVAYDLLLRGGNVIDGTRAPRYRGDVAVRDGRVVAIGGELDAAIAARVLDVEGLVVAPGFWDNHAHLEDLEEHPSAENFLRQGITTIIGSLHSQDQMHPLGEYRERVAMAPNVGLYAGHTWIRKQVLELENRAPSAAELETMKHLVREAMAGGAMGLGTGLEYVPATYAGLPELVALAQVAAEAGGIYATHLRDEGVRVREAVLEALEIGRQAQIPVHINHLKVTGAAHFGQAREILDLLDAARDEGLEVAHDVYPYTAYSTYSDLMFPPWSLADGAEAFARRVADPATRARLVEEMIVRFRQQAGEGPQSIVFREVADRPELTGRSLADYLRAAGREETIEAAVDALIELQLSGGFIGIFFGMDDGDVRTFLEHPLTMVESDGDLVQPEVGHPHPRSYGSIPRVLAQYVREEGLLSLEAAIHRLTLLPARWHGQSERGILVEAAIADVVVFNAEEIRGPATYVDPHHYAEGVVHLLVGGELVLESGELTDARPGRFLEAPRSPRSSDSSG